MTDDALLTCENLRDQLFAAFTSGSEGDAGSMKQGLSLTAGAIEKCPDALQSIAVEFLAHLVSLESSGLDKVAEMLMEANPALFESAVFKAAEACLCPYCKFILVRAVFRRFPGRYRPYMLAVGRELLRQESSPRVSLAVTWLIWKFGAELVPDLLAYMNEKVCVEDRCLVLSEAVRCLGTGALPIVQAAAGSGEPALEAASAESYRKLGSEPN